MIASFVRVQFAAALALACICTAAPRAQAQAAPDYAALLAAPDRSDNDRATDKRRDPLPFLQFAGPASGHESARYGRRRRLFDRTDGARGSAERQGLRPEPADASDKMKTAFEARLATPGMKDAAADAQPFDNPAPPGVNDLDMITFLFFYHDTTYMPVDRVAMDKAMFAALKPGGLLIIADHAAQPGQGTTVGKTLHRIDEDTLKQEVEAAGFKLVGEGNFWRNSADTKDYPSYKKDVPIDNFVLKFQKPN